MAAGIPTGAAGAPTPASPAGYEDHKTDLLGRLRRIEGQVRGLQRMIEEDRYCIDVLTQVAAARSALARVGLTLLESHTRGCVAKAIRDDGDGTDAVDELLDVVARFVR